MKIKNEFRNVPRFKDIKEIIYNSAKLYSDNIAYTTKVVEGQGAKYVSHTYRELLENINAFGTSLYGLGLKDKRVAVIGYNRYEWVVAHLANLLGGIVSVPLDKGLQLEELEDSLVRSEVEAIVFDEKLEELLREIIKRGKTKIKHYICMESLEGFISFYDLVENGRQEIKKKNYEYIEHKVDEMRMSILLFTSGTTSKSKAVMLNQYGIATNTYDIQIVETIYPTDVNIAFLPYHHIFGSTTMLVMLSMGVKTVFTDGLKYIKQNLLEYKVSVFVGVPALIDKIYESVQEGIKKQGKTALVNTMISISNVLLKLHIDIRKKLFKPIIDQLGGGMRFIISGGAPLDKRTSKWFNSIGIHLVQGYGLTETSSVISAENDYFVRPGSVGIPMKNVEVEIDNKDDNGIGEIIVRGSLVMMGYYNDEEQTNEVIKNGWFHTGDLGYIDKDGFIFITGRSKDLIVLKNGKKVFPEEIEMILNRIEEIEESLVYGLPEKDDKNDVKVAVKVVYNEKKINELHDNINEKELRNIIWNKIKELNKTLPKYKYIKELSLTTEPFVKTSTNKIKRKVEIAKILEGK